MLSVLIPVYNYNIIVLVTEIHKQLLLCNILFEIRCLDDCSQTQFTKQNKIITQLSNTFYSVSKKNKGRIETRRYLADQAIYNWILFMDADVFPKHPNYISKYISVVHSGYDAVYGGIAYKQTRPKSDVVLRWKYGKAKEEIKADIRNKRPYKIVVSANFLIKKVLFKRINSKIVGNYYGFDNYFGALLKAEQTPVFHIENEVYHLGIENSKSYLKKKEAAAITLIKLYREQKISTHDNDLLRLFLSLKRYKIHYLFSLTYSMFFKFFKKHLFSKNPSMLILQLYRISFMCNMDAKQKKIR